MLDPSLWSAPVGSVEHTRLVEELEAEAALLSSLRHSNVLIIHGICLDAARRPKWLICELAHSTYSGYLRMGGRCLTPAVLRDDCRQILSGLSYLHTLRHRVIHRDLKPGVRGRPCSFCVLTTSLTVAEMRVGCVREHVHACPCV